MGGAAAAIAAVARPKLFSALVLFEPICIPRKFIEAVPWSRDDPDAPDHPLAIKAERRTDRFASCVCGVGQAAACSARAHHADGHLVGMMKPGRIAAARGCFGAGIVRRWKGKCVGAPRYVDGASVH